MFRIGDFSRFGRVSVKTLRYYDEVGLLKPAKVDRFTGYRYYSGDQLPRLNRILALKNLGLSLEDVAKLLSNDPPLAKIRDVLQSRLAEIRQRLSEDQGRILRMEELLRQMDKEGTMADYEVVIKKVDAEMVASVRDVIPVYSDVGRLFEEIFACLGRNGVPPVGPTVAIYYDEEYTEQNVAVEAAVPIGKKIAGTERIVIRELPAVEQMACVIHQGDYGDVGQAYQALMTWIEHNGYRIIDPNREVYIQGPGQNVDPKSYVTEIQFPVEKS